MKKVIYLIFTLSLIFLSCNTSTQSSVPQEPEEEVIPLTPLEHSVWDPENIYKNNAGEPDTDDMGNDFFYERVSGTTGILGKYKCLYNGKITEFEYLDGGICRIRSYSESQNPLFVDFNYFYYAISPILNQSQACILIVYFREVVDPDHVILYWASHISNNYATLPPNLEM